MSAHDQWLADYRQHLAQVWCSNPACPVFEDGMEVMFVSEYGQGWYEPEDCPLCRHELVEDKPERDEDAA